MARLIFSELKLPVLKNRMAGPSYQRFKKTILALMFTQRLDVFQSESSNDGPWKPLKKATARRRVKKIPKKKRKKGFKILQDNGVLRQSMTTDGAPEQETSIDGDEVSLASNVEYAAIHNFGGTINHPGTENGFGRGIKIPPHKINIDARPFDQFTPTHIREHKELADSYLNEPQGAFNG